MPLVQLGVEQTLSWSEGPRRRPALDCLSAKFEEPDVDVKVLIDTQAKSWRRAHFVSHTHSAAQSTVTDFYSDPSLFRRTCPSTACALPKAPRRRPFLRLDWQNYYSAARHVGRHKVTSTRHFTLHQRGGRLWTHYICGELEKPGREQTEGNEERQDGENEKMRQKGKDGEQIDAFTSWLVLLKSSG